MVAWRVAKSLNTILTQVNAMAPERSKVTDGTIGDEAHQDRTSDHNPWVEDPPGPNVVTARDITHDPGEGCDVGLIFEAIRLSEDGRVKYAIFNGELFSSYPAHGFQPYTWRPYSNAVAMPHDGHGHLSVQPDKDKYDDTDPWDIGDNMGVGPLTDNDLDKLKNFLEVLYADEPDGAGSDTSFTRYVIPAFRVLGAALGGLDTRLDVLESGGVTDRETKVLVAELKLQIADIRAGLLAAAT